jgi:hypothetical protein
MLTENVLVYMEGLVIVAAGARGNEPFDWGAGIP